MKSIKKTEIAPKKKRRNRQHVVHSQSIIRLAGRIKKKVQQSREAGDEAGIHGNMIQAANLALTIWAEEATAEAKYTRSLR